MIDLVRFIVKLLIVVVYVHIVRISLEVMYRLISECDSFISLASIVFFCTIWILLMILGVMLVIAILIEPINKDKR